MKKTSFMLLYILLFASTCAASAQKVIITSDPDYPPISWQDRANPDRIVGVAIELAENAFRELGIDVESRYVGPWKRALLMGENGEVDVIAGLYLTVEREKRFDFVFPPILPDPIVLFVMKGREFPFQKWEDLIGIPGGARRGDSFGEQFDAFAIASLSLDEATDFQQLYRKLEANRHKYFIFGLYPGLAQAQELGVRETLAYLPHPVASEDIYIAFSKKSKYASNKDAIGSILQKYVSEGKVDALIEKYLSIWKEQEKNK